jgi:hypothetical protein
MKVQPKKQIFSQVATTAVTIFTWLLYHYLGSPPMEATKHLSVAWKIDPSNVYLYTKLHITNPPRSLSLKPFPKY